MVRLDSHITTSSSGGILAAGEIGEIAHAGRLCDFIGVAVRRLADHVGL